MTKNSKTIRTKYDDLVRYTVVETVNFKCSVYRDIATYSGFITVSDGKLLTNSQIDTFIQAARELLCLN